ncbi:hypothetical protein BU26DRAFT_606604 [Trematosphaeria pertusa]|uniref:Extracellular membrane protein CFEM domain-containing protein n=1 Tax=Trematosphaeria pertusa TaxID=390896 RepID=A0A6A6ICW6_9PLEO|nr:uncharacterized protein BU26DRAFT_606604 [Trematosphaeria pertusa]KAF2247742.1 hypothetical protein BU26DRAFT_606604 [Trematosphaeria pertusa]
MKLLHFLYGALALSTSVSAYTLPKARESLVTSWNGTANSTSSAIPYSSATPIYNSTYSTSKDAVSSPNNVSEPLPSPIASSWPSPVLWANSTSSNTNSTKLPLSSLNINTTSSSASPKKALSNPGPDKASSNPTRDPDTLAHTQGLPNPHDVSRTKLTTFCGTSSTERAHCRALASHVHQCSGAQRPCPDGLARDLLASTVALDPCAAADEHLESALCEKWAVEARRCRDASKRACGHHHVLYLLRGMRDFLGLEAE